MRYIISDRALPYHRAPICKQDLGLLHPQGALPHNWPLIRGQGPWHGDRCNESQLSFLKGTALHFILSAGPAEAN